MENKNSSRALRIMHFVHWSRSGITSLVRDISRNGNDHIIFFLLLLGDDEFFEYYGKINSKVALEADRKPLRSIYLSTRCYKEFKPNIVHVHSFTPLCFASVLFLKSKIVFHAHSYYSYFDDRRLKSIIKKIILLFLLRARKVRVITVSKQIENFFRNQKIDAFFIKNGVSGEGTIRPLFSQVNQKGRFYTVSRLHPEKNIYYAIEIIRSLRNHGHAITFDIFGSGDESQLLREFINQSGLQDVVRLKGFISEPRYLPCDYDFYLSTSIVEGIGLSMIEALRGRTPVIMTPVGELANILKDNESTVLIEFKLQAAVNKIDKLLKCSVPFMDGLQARGRKIFEDNFTIGKFVKSLDSIYRKL